MQSSRELGRPLVRRREDRDVSWSHAANPTRDPVDDRGLVRFVEHSLDAFCDRARVVTLVSTFQTPEPDWRERRSGIRHRTSGGGRDLLAREAVTREAEREELGASNDELGTRAVVVLEPIAPTALPADPVGDGVHEEGVRAGIFEDALFAISDPDRAARDRVQSYE
ncbi:MAG: hypothetical protein U0270_23905 [Labilithrix sp.]